MEAIILGIFHMSPVFSTRNQGLSPAVLPTKKMYVCLADRLTCISDANIINY